MMRVIDKSKVRKELAKKRCRLMELHQEIIAWSLMEPTPFNKERLGHKRSEEYAVMSSIEYLESIL